MVSKRLLVFCDGDAQPLVPQPSSASNVSRLFCSVNKLSKDNNPKEQIVFYQSGYEPGLAADGSGVAGLSDVLGIKMASKIRDAYFFISQNFDLGDEIFLFGFSSGAYALRKLIELIDDAGILEPSALGQFFRIWRNITAGHPVDSPPGTRRTKIRCVGLWDTVGTVYESIDALALKHSVLPPSVDVALHALSFQENRLDFAPTIWRMPKSRWGSQQILKEVWFPGSHGDVGGIYERHELADISLFWMVGEILELGLFDLDPDLIMQSKQPRPNVWNALQPSDIVQTNAKIKDRLSSGHIARDSRLHWSCVPQKPHGEFRLLGHQTLQNSLGRLKYANMNRFENDCNAHWDEEYMDIPTSVCVNASQLFLKDESAIDLGDCKVTDTEPRVLSTIPGNIMKVSLTHDNSHYTLQRRGELDDTRPLTPSRWIRIEGIFTLDKLNGLVPVIADKDAEIIYTAQAYLNGELHKGAVREGQDRFINRDGEEFSVNTYNVLVLDSYDCLFNHGIGQAEYPQDSGNGDYTYNNPQIIKFPPEATSPTPPRVVPGLNFFAFQRYTWPMQIKAYADDITVDHFTTHIDCPETSKISGGGISWLRLSAADPDFQCGVHNQSGDPSESTLISFGWKFKSPPNVFVGLCGFDFKDQGQGRLSVSATNISRSGFQLYIDKGSTDTTLIACSVTWIAFPADKKSVSYGTFGINTSASYESGSVSFTSTFKRPPTIFTALQNFDIYSSSYNITRVRAWTNSVTTTEMKWLIEPGGGGGINKLRVAYLALDHGD